MSKKSQTDHVAEIKLEKKENYPQLKERTKATVLAKHSNGLYLDIARSFEGYVSPRELGDKSLEDYSIGEVIEVYVASEDRNQPGIFKLSIKQLEENHKWERLESLKEIELELKISKVLKSGIEVEIIETKQTGFIPYGYVDIREEPLKSKDKTEWIGLVITGKVHEHDQSRNKIILNQRTITELKREQRAKTILHTITKGQKIKGTVVRIAEFGAFVDIGGIDALIPSSELSWTRFKQPSDVIKVGEEIEAVVFKIDTEKNRIALSIKQTNANPWSDVASKILIGHKGKGKVVTQAEFGVFVEVIPGVEALLHKSLFNEADKPELGKEIEYEVINLEADKKRMGIKPIKTSLPDDQVDQKEQKEIEHV
ncbi:MAG: S1 RNA-binding domain-containing protein [Cyanobacteria bacterium]|nr:S1 RNA-binding domain-containing protein [Cyanobacteriota bacterium]MDA1021469.1 S1 RNA-binding domain-containing protein [Cyanobacteriota bacterium]